MLFQGVCGVQTCSLPSSTGGMWGFLSFCFFKQKTAYEMRISDWSSDVCSSDLFYILVNQQLNFHLFQFQFQQQRWHHQQQFDRRYACSRAAHDPALRCGRRSACRAETVELERPGPVGLTSPVLQSPSFMPAIFFFRCPELCARSEDRKNVG